MQAVTRRQLYAAAKQFIVKIELKPQKQNMLNKTTQQRHTENKEQNKSKHRARKEESDRKMYKTEEKCKLPDCGSGARAAERSGVARLNQDLYATKELT